jgi:hypothetical protein
LFYPEELERNIEYGKKYLQHISEIKTSTALIDFLKERAVSSSVIKAAELEIGKFVIIHRKVVGSDMERLETEISGMLGFRDTVQTYIEHKIKFNSFAEFLIKKRGKYEIYSNNKPFQTEVTVNSYQNLIAHLLTCKIDSDQVKNALRSEPFSDELQLLDRIRSEMLIVDSKMEKRENFVGYSGQYILASKIERPKDIKGQLVIKATHKFFLDADLELTDAHLTIMAPIVEVVGTNRKITMRGSSGATHPIKAAVGQHGSHGKPGHASGDIYIMALDVTNAQSLQIVSLGGDGADGQEGGNGRDGQKCEAPKFLNLQGTNSEIATTVHKEGYKARWQYHSKIVKVVKTFFVWIYNYRRIFESMTLSVINESKRPTNGMNGGSAGAGAPPGAQHFLLKNSDTKIAAENSYGTCGKVGKGGLAGATVPECCQVDYLCSGENAFENLFVYIVIKEYRVIYPKCLPQPHPLTLLCDKLAAENGQDGAASEQSIGALVPKHPFDFSPAENFQVFLKASAQENGSELKDFLKYLATLNDSNGCNLSEGVCRKQ